MCDSGIRTMSSEDGGGHVGPLAVGPTVIKDTRSSLAREMSRKFKTEWLTLFPWAFVENEVVFCRICLKTNQKNVFTTGKPVGLRPKKDCFVKHEQGTGHKFAVVATFEGSNEAVEGKAGAQEQQHKMPQRAPSLNGDMERAHFMTSIFGLANREETGVPSGRENWTEEGSKTEFKFEEPDPSSGSDDTMADSPAAATSLEVVVPHMHTDGPPSTDEPETIYSNLKERYRLSERRDEFDQFGMNVGSQLRAMPLRAALEAQLEIQRVLTLKRLECLE